MGKKKKSKKKSKASKADRYALYLHSVQAPSYDVKFFRRVYKSYFDEKPKILREDFCGTAAVCCHWVKGRPDCFGYGVDLDPEPLFWGEEHNLKALKAADRARVHLIQGDVRTAVTPKADVVAAQNFSYCTFKTRDALREYFRAALSQLADRGVLVLDLFGGYESIEDNREDVVEYDEFDYVWEQAKFDPITHDSEFHIHFRFADGSELQRAFSYHWRLWTIPEVRELLLEAGFDRADVYWEGTDEDGDGDGVFRRQEQGESDPAWNAYVIGIKGPAKG